jgi:hypothetical protein
VPFVELEGQGQLLARRWMLEGLVLVLGAATLAAVWFGGSVPRAIGFPLDDAWIHMVYGRSLAEHGMLAYNAGTPATGSTSPLWAGLVGVAHLFGAGDVDRTIVLVFAIGAACQLATAVVVCKLALVTTGDRVAALIAGAITAICGPLAAAAFSGMEVSLTAMLLVTGVLACLRHAWRRAGIWLALAALARPEAATVSVVCFAYCYECTRAASPRARAAALARLTVASIVLGLLLVSHALAVTGKPLPATFYAKQRLSLTELPERLRNAITYLISGVPPFKTTLPYLALGGLVVPGLLRPRKPRGRLLLPAATGVAFLFANLAVMRPVSDFCHLRYLLPAVPLLITAMITGAYELGRVPPFARSLLTAYVPTLIALAIGVYESATSIGATATRLHNDTRNINEVQRVLGDWVADHTAPGTWIAVSDAGALKYFGDRPTIDVMGLNTPELYADATWGAAHPVAAIVLIQCWFGSVSSALHVATRAHTDDYTVTPLECMREQVVLTCTGKEDQPFEVSGSVSFRLVCRPGELVDGRDQCPAGSTAEWRCGSVDAARPGSR